MAAALVLAGVGGLARAELRSDRASPPADPATIPTPHTSAAPSSRPASPIVRPSPGPSPTKTACRISPQVFGSNFRRYVESREGDLNAAVYDAVGGRTFVYGDSDEFHTGSIVKVQILGTLLYRVQAEHRDLTADEQLLATRMIEISDNDSATALWNEVGGSYGVSGFDRLAGMTDTAPNAAHWGDTTTTALDNVHLVRHIAFENDVLSARRREEALELMEHVTPSQRWGVPTGVPAGFTVAVKNGWLPLAPSDWEINTIGFVKGGGHRYVLAVLSQGSPTQDYGVDTVDHVSQMVWRASQC